MKSARETAGLSQEKLAASAKVSRVYISQLERNLKSPTIDVLARICHALGTTPAKLLSRLEGIKSAKRPST